MSYVTRSRVLTPRREILAVLPTWSDGAVVRQARPDLLVQDGEWLGASVRNAPDPTHASGAAFLIESAESAEAWEPAP